MFSRSAFGYSPANEGDLRLRLDASRTSTLTVASGVVSAWASRASYAATLAQATSGTRPAYSATLWDGSRPAVSFTNSSPAYTDLHVSGVTGVTDFVGTASDVTIVIRLKRPGSGSPIGDLFQSYNAGLTAGALDVRFRGTTALEVAWSSGGGSAFGGATYDTSAHTAAVVTSAGTGMIQTYKDAVADLAATAFTPGSPDSISIGAAAALGVNPVECKIAEVLVYKSVLSSAAIARVHAYLAAKWP